MQFIILASTFLFSSSLAFAQQGPLRDLNMSINVDMVAPYQMMPDRPDTPAGVRSAELLFYAPIDHVFDGVVNIAGHQENGEFHFGLHEAYVSTSKLIPRSRVRVGKYLLNLGRLNSFHQHDWPFTSPPKVFREFFSEGVFDTGAEYAWLLPTNRFHELTIGVVNGYCYGHCEELEGRPPRPTFYTRWSTFFEPSVQLGFNYLNRKTWEKDYVQLAGVDLTYKQRSGKVIRWLVQSEAYYENRDPRISGPTERVGFYSYPEYGFDENWRLGLRVDAFSQLAQNGVDFGLSPTLTYKTSEFATGRLSYTYEDEFAADPSHLVELQFVFFLGSHPTHDF